MFEFLYKNPEIRNFLDSFPTNHRLQLIEMLLMYSIRKFSSKNLSLTLESVTLLLSLTPCNMKHTIDSMKRDLKDLKKSIKRIELTNSSPTSKKRPSSSIQIKKSSVQFSPECFSPTHDIKEPKICPLNDAHLLLNSINTPKKSPKKNPNNEHNRVNSNFLTQPASPQFFAVAPPKHNKFKRN